MSPGAPNEMTNHRALAGRAAVAVTGAIALLAGTAMTAAPAAAGTGERLRHDVREIERLGVTGVVAEVRTPDGRFTARAGVADRRTGRPAQPGDHFRAASVTKTYVATVVLQLVGEGRLSLDDTVDEWLPGLVRGNGNDGRRITIRHLLQHTSGLHDYLSEIPLQRSAEDYREHRFDRYTPDRLVALALKHEPGFQPGETNPDGTPKWSYSNTGYALLGMIIEKASGKDWRVQVRDRVIRPLRLHGTHTPGHRATLPRPFLRGYRQYEEGAPPTDVTLLDPSVAGASGGMITTVSDDNRFFRALIGGRLVPRVLLAEMQRTVPTGWDGAYQGSRYGLGLFWFPLRCDRAGYWAHGGDMLGHMVREGVRADGGRSVSVAMSTQLTGGGGERLNTAAAEAVENALC
ncbi:serine hydrolase domain-containing protein [Actinomadura sp. 7K507]|uniref:serine hydrolase domain-containing protein n=1 Tax=Actinomadura sp. 7K507 TaxID=2530365 RepID=UPI001045C730|nr:serine hydrolase domain-containing protein [Actinomadura sp. 7K507]TDC94292.1 class A beta-lactamase-related serine hydrolase [Actinomadura sp. 7K507]